jgi:hypothetical protein
VARGTTRILKKTIQGREVPLDKLDLEIDVVKLRFRSADEVPNPWATSNRPAASHLVWKRQRKRVINTPTHQTAHPSYHFPEALCHNKVHRLAQDSECFLLWDLIVQQA